MANSKTASIIQGFVNNKVNNGKASTPLEATGLADVRSPEGIDAVANKTNNPETTKVIMNYINNKYGGLVNSIPTIDYGTDNEMAAYINTIYPNSGATVSRTYDTNKKTYNYTLTYIDPDTKKTVSHSFKARKAAHYTEEELADLLSLDTDLGKALNTRSVAVSNAKATVKELDNIQDYSGVGATTDRDLTAKDYEAITIAQPKASKDHLGNQLSDAEWLGSLVPALSSLIGKDESFDGKELTEHLNDADGVIKADKTLADIDVASLQDLAKRIQVDTTVAAAVREQLYTGHTQNNIAGQIIGNTQNAAAKAQAEQRAVADEEYAKLASEEGTASKLRDSVYSSSVQGLTNYTQQQINKAYADGQIRLDEANALLALTTLATQMTTAEQRQIARDVNDALAVAENNAEQIKARNDADQALEEALNTAQTDAYQGRVESVIGGASNAGSNHNYSKAVNQKGNVYSGNVTPQTSKVNYVDPKYLTADYIDETAYNTLKNSEGWDKIFDQNTFDRLTKLKKADGVFYDDITNENLAAAYGLAYLINAEDTEAKFDEYADQANKESDRIFNTAQRAYLAAVAAGDTQTTEQLVRMAKSAGSGKQNLYDASLLTNQISQQTANRALGDNLAHDYQRQQALNEKQKATAKLQANSNRNDWLGDGNPDSAQGGLYGATSVHKQGATSALDSYGTLAGLNMDYQGFINDMISTSTIAGNKNISGVAANITGNNASGGVNNISNSTRARLVKNKKNAEKQLQQMVANGEI